MMKHVDAINAGEMSASQRGFDEEDFKFMTSSTENKGEESEVEEVPLTTAELARADEAMEARPLDASDTEQEDFGHIPPPAPNVITTGLGPMDALRDVTDGQYQMYSKERLILCLQLAKDAWRIERGRSNYKTVIIGQKDKSIEDHERLKRKAEVTCDTALKENKRLKSTVSGLKIERTAWQETVDVQRQEIEKLKNRRLLLRQRLLALRGEANHTSTQLSEQTSLNNRLRRMIRYQERVNPQTGESLPSAAALDAAEDAAEDADAETTQDPEDQQEAEEPSSEEWHP
jgi:hypothetical protein